MKTILLAGTAALALFPAIANAQPKNAGPPDARTETNAPTDPGGSSSRPEGRPVDASAPQNAGPPDARTEDNAPADPASAAAGSALDTLAPAEDAVSAAAPARTGDPVLDRLNALEAKVEALEARNRQLEQAAATTQDRVQKVEVRAARGVQPGIAPTFADATGEIFTFKPRGMIQIDYAAFNERKGGYDYNNGTQIRRGRFGFDGTFYRRFKYRIEAEYVGNAVNLLDAYVSYAPTAKTLVTIGQQKAPYGLEANTSDAFNEFLERGMANNAFGAVGAERRVGVTLAYITPKITATVGLFGAGEAVGRNATTPGETYGVNGRVTWEPINADGRVLHLGASGYHVTDFAANSVTVGDRPNVRVDGGLLESVAIAGTKPAGAAQTGVKNGDLYAFEGAGVFGPFSLQGEYQHLKLTPLRHRPGRDVRRLLRLRQPVPHGRIPRVQERRDRPAAPAQRLRSFRRPLGRVRARRALRPAGPHRCIAFGADAARPQHHGRVQLVSERQPQAAVQLYPLHRHQFAAGGGARGDQRHDR